MVVVSVFKSNWGTTYYGYGKGGNLYRWSVDNAGLYGLSRVPWIGY